MVFPMLMEHTQLVGLCDYTHVILSLQAVL